MDAESISQEDVIESCDCHVCSTLRTVFRGDAPSVTTPALMTNEQAAAFLGVTSQVVRELVGSGELRTVQILSYSRRRIPKVEIDAYLERAALGTLREWVELRRENHLWGLRFMKAQRARVWHMGDGKAALCGAQQGDKPWEVVARPYWYYHICPECQFRKEEMILAKGERKARPKPVSLRPMLTVVVTSGGETVRRASWHLGDGKTTLCGITRDRWVLPERRPRKAPCKICARVGGLDETPDWTLPTRA